MADRDSMIPTSLKSMPLEVSSRNIERSSRKKFGSPTPRHLMGNSAAHGLWRIALVLGIGGVEAQLTSNRAGV